MTSHNLCIIFYPRSPSIIPFLQHYILYSIGSRYRYKGVSLSVHSPGLVICTYWASLLVGRIKKWPRPRPCYQYSVQITMYVGINFVPIKNQKRGVSLSVLYQERALVYFNKILDLAPYLAVTSFIDTSFSYSQSRF